MAYFPSPSDTKCSRFSRFAKFWRRNLSTFDVHFFWADKQLSPTYSLFGRMVEGARFGCPVNRTFECANTTMLKNYLCGFSDSMGLSYDLKAPVVTLDQFNSMQW